MMKIRRALATATIVLSLIGIEQSSALDFLGFKLPSIEKQTFKRTRGEPLLHSEPTKRLLLGKSKWQAINNMINTNNY
jgi:hypothetical protein